MVPYSLPPNKKCFWCNINDTILNWILNYLYLANHSIATETIETGVMVLHVADFVIEVG